jgi:hypothetical protein
MNLFGINEATNFRALTRCMKESFIIRHERARRIFRYRVYSVTLDNIFYVGM